jgi:hypothetical protein
MYLSPIASVDVVQVFVALVVIIVSYHFVRLTFETHTLVASTTCHSVTAVYSDNRNLTFFIRTLSNTIFKHIFFEELITSKFGLLAGQSGMVSILS